MAASGYSPIQLYYSTTASTAPAAGNLVSGELAINITDGKLYYKDNAGAVQLLSTSTTANGTANGVLYLNGSKVATSGSALTFDGTNLGVAMPNPASFLGKFGVNGNIALGTGGIQYFWNSSNVYGWSIRNAVNDLTFANYGGSDQMTLTSTGLGIGTTAPAYKLDVQSTGATTVGRFRTGSTLTSTIVDFGRTDQAVNAAIVYDGTGFIRFGTTTAHNLTLMTGAVDRVTLDSSGNLGLGVTPSAWLANSQAIQNSSGALWQYGGANIYLGQNYYLNGSVQRIYATSAAATEYNQAGGAHRWYNAPSGTAGNAISFTQAMTLDASGNLIVGGTSASTASATTLYNDGTIVSILGNGVGGTSIFGAISGVSNGYEIAVTSGNAQTYKWFNGGTQSMTLDASGNLLVGTTTSSGYNMTVSGAASTVTGIKLINTSGSSSNLCMFAASSTYASFGVAANSGWLAVEGANNLTVGPTGAGAVTFVNNGSERARIDSSGNLLVGITSSSDRKLYVKGTPASATYLTSLENTGTTAANVYGLQIYYSGVTPNSAGSYFIDCTDPTAIRFRVYSNGGLANYQGNDSNLSDRREKTNFAPAGEYLSKICAIPVQTFNYIDQAQDDPGLTLGVVAQDVQAVAPELVTESNWGTEEEPKMRLSIYQTDLQYALMKCIQEQQAQIESLRKRLADAGIA